MVSKTEIISSVSECFEFALSIVVPVYNGASSIGVLVDALAQLDVEGGSNWLVYLGLGAILVGVALLGALLFTLLRR